MKEIYIGGGCFWGVQGYFAQAKGVLETEVGYLNGPMKKVTYGEVSGQSGHVEVVKVVFDPKQITMQNIFDLFIRIIDPFSFNKQGNDTGLQYRTGIYSRDKQDVLHFKDLLKEWETNNGASQIEVLDVIGYVMAEAKHQDYLRKNPGGYCHINLNDIPEKFKK